MPCCPGVHYYYVQVFYEHLQKVENSLRQSEQLNILMFKGVEKHGGFLPETVPHLSRGGAWYCSSAAVLDTTHGQVWCFFWNKVGLFFCSHTTLLTRPTRLFNFWFTEGKSVADRRHRNPLPQQICFSYFLYRFLRARNGRYEDDFTFSHSLVFFSSVTL